MAKAWRLIPEGTLCGAIEGCSQLATETHHTLRSLPEYRVKVDGTALRNHSQHLQRLCWDHHQLNGHNRHDKTAKWPAGKGFIDAPFRI